MEVPTQTFTYTALRNRFFVLVGSFTFLFLVELGLMALVFAFVIHNPFWTWLLDVLHILLVITAIGGLFRPLWTRHRLTATHLHLHLGSTRFSIPLEAIESVEAVLDRDAASMPLTGRYDAKKRRMILCFSDLGQVLLILKRPLPHKAGRKIYKVSRVLFNVDQRDVLLAELSKNLGDNKSGELSPSIYQY